jgi:hypothetical protein
MTICDVATSTDEAPQFRRRWFQFGLRTLLVGMLVLGTAGGILARWINWNNRRQAIKLLIAEGYDLELAPVSEPLYLPGLPGPEPPETWDMVVGVDSSPIGLGNVTPEKLNVIARLPNLQRLTITNYGSELLPPLASRRSLRLVSIHGAALRPKDANRIAECEFLSSLTIRVDAHSTKELGVLDRLKHLRSLRICGHLNDEVALSWQGMTSLEEITLESCYYVSDRALAELIQRNPLLCQIELIDANCTMEVCKTLRQCKSLKQLQLIDCKLDDEGRAELRAATQIDAMVISTWQQRLMPDLSRAPLTIVWDRFTPPQADDHPAQPMPDAASGEPE